MLLPYDRSLPREDRKARGIFYTPAWVVDHIVERVVRPGDSVLDLACGAGAFLAAALRAGAGSVCGIDTDARALELAAAECPGATLIHGDALLWPLEPADVVIGNPPYLSIDNHGLNTPVLRKRFTNIYRDKTDLSYYFLARAVELARRSVGLIVPRAFLEAYKADRLRKFLSEQTRIVEIVDFGERRVFPDAGIATCIVILEAGAAGDCEGHGAPWVIVPDRIRELHAKIDAAGSPLGDVLVVGQGMQTGRNGVFGNRTKADWEDAPEVHRKRARNTDIQRNAIRDRGEYVLYVEDVECFGALPAHVRAHLESHRGELEARAAFRRGDCEWWRYTWPLHKDLYSRRRILCPYLAGMNRFALDRERDFLGLTDTTLLFDNGQPEDLEYVLALLNSKLLAFRYRAIGKLRSPGIREYFWNGVSRLPLRRAHGNPLADLEGTDLDHAICELYDLTGEEIGLVESQIGPVVLNFRNADLASL